MLEDKICKCRWTNNEEMQIAAAVSSLLFKKLLRQKSGGKKSANPFWKLTEQDVVTILTVGNYDTGGCTARV